MYCGYLFEVDHVIPSFAGGRTQADNLALACSNCNGHKAARLQAIDPETNALAPLFNPRRDVWEDHFSWSENGSRIIGRTAIGRASIATLQMNNNAIVFARAFWVKFGLHPPKSSL